MFGIWKPDRKPHWKFVMSNYVCVYYAYSTFWFDVYNLSKVPDFLILTCLLVISLCGMLYKFFAVICSEFIVIVVTSSLTTATYLRHIGFLLLPNVTPKWQNIFFAIYRGMFAIYNTRAIAIDFHLKPSITYLCQFQSQFILLYWA